MQKPMSVLLKQRIIDESVKDDGLKLNQKRVLIREDFNVPLDDQGHITSFARIEAALPAIEYARKQNARIMLMSHLGGPQEGLFDCSFFTKPVAEKLSELLNQPVTLKTNCLNLLIFSLAK